MRILGLQLGYGVPRTPANERSNPATVMRNKQPLLLFCLAVLLLAFSGSVYAQLSDVTQPGDTIVPTSNNSPGSEGVANAIDNTQNKYLNFDINNTGFTVTPGVGLTVVQCITLISANDAPDRDPASY